MTARNPREHVSNLLKELENWLERKGFSTLEEAVGFIHKR